MSRYVIAVAAFSLVTLGCPSPQSLCESGVDQVCERVHECQSDQVKASPQFQAAFGTSAENCKELLYENPGRPQQQQAIACADVDDDQKLCANLGQPGADEFVLGKASECKDARADMSCEDYLAQLQNPAIAPASCAERCK